MNAIKKHFCILLAALFACLACACSIGRSGEDKTDVPIAPMPEASISPPEQPSIPFYGIDELRAFIAAAELSDAELERFIKENEYDIYGIQNRADLKRMLERFDKLPFPTSDEYKFNFMSFFTELGNSTIVYLLDKGHCYFIIDLESETNSQEAAFKKALAANNLSQLEFKRSDHNRKLYVVENTEAYYKDNGVSSSAESVIFFADIDGSVISIETVQLSRAEAENAICAFEFGKLTDIIGE